MSPMEGTTLRKNYLEEYLELSRELNVILRHSEDPGEADIDRIEACVDNRDVVIKKLKDLDLRFPAGDSEKHVYTEILEKIKALEDDNVKVLEDITTYFRNEAGKQKKMNDGLSAYWAQQNVGNSGQVFER